MKELQKHFFCGISPLRELCGTLVLVTLSTTLKMTKMTYLSMSTPTDVVIMHCPITANRPINPISWSEIEKGRKLLTITLNHEPRTPYQAHKFSEQNLKKTHCRPKRQNRPSCAPSEKCRVGRFSGKTSQ